MRPVSKERLAWVSDRLLLLDEMIKEFVHSPTRFATVYESVSVVLNELKHERIKLLVEQQVLTDFFNSKDSD